jgi:hypothetical protein
VAGGNRAGGAHHLQAQSHTELTGVYQVNADTPHCFGANARGV